MRFARGGMRGPVEWWPFNDGKVKATGMPGMHAVSQALAYAVRDLREPRIVAVIAVPPLAAIGVWIALGWGFSDDWTRWVADAIADNSWLAWLSKFGLGSVLVWGSGIAVLALLLPVLFVTAVVVAGLVAMPVIVPWVAARRFPALAEKRGGSLAGSIGNTVVATLIFLTLWVVTLPLWFTGIGAVILPAVLSAHLNQRLFRYDALQDHASAAEYVEIRTRARWHLFVLGLALACLFYVPVVNLAAPGLSALAFTHFCLAELHTLRAGAR